jgi:hypothetical protein
MRATLESLEARLLALQDAEAIESLKARYWRAVDRKSPADVEACLHVQAIVDFEGLPRCESRAAFMTIVREAASQSQAYNMHHGQNPHITRTDPDTAAGTWDIFFYGIDLAANTLVQMAGTYNDTYIREKGTWLIATTTMRILSLHVQTTKPILATLSLAPAMAN